MERPAGMLLAGLRMQFYEKMGGVVVMNTTVRVRSAIWVGG